MPNRGLLYVCDDLGNWIPCVATLASIPDVDALNLQGGEILQFDVATQKWTTTSIPGSVHNPATVTDTSTINMTITDQDIRADLRMDNIYVDDFAVRANVPAGYVMTAYGESSGIAYWAPSSGSAAVDSVGDTTTIDLTLTNGQITAALKDTTVTPGTYNNANITVDAQGRLTAAFSGSSGSGGADATAFHSDVSGEIHLLTEKTTPVSADEIVIEDSADSYAKKRVQVGNLPGGTAETPPALRVYMASTFH